MESFLVLFMKLPVWLIRNSTSYRGAYSLTFPGPQSSQPHPVDSGGFSGGNSVKDSCPVITGSTVARPCKLCLIPYVHPATQYMGLLTPARLPHEELRPRGLAIFPGSRASEGCSGLRALFSIPLKPPPFPPTTGHDLTLRLLIPSSSQC